MEKGTKKYEEKSKEQLIERIKELEDLLDNIMYEKSKSEEMAFPWVGNLGQWYWMVKSNDVLCNDQKILVLGYDLSEVDRNVGYKFFTDKIHPDDYEYVMDNMRRHLRAEIPAYEVEYRIRKKDGTYMWFYDRGKVTKRDIDGSPITVVGIVFDITKRKILEKELIASNKKLKQLATTDELTGILNRRTIITTLKNEMKRTNRTNSHFCLIMFDIDYFKKVNDTYGHNTGDIVLKSISNDVKRRIRDTDIFGRWGGEEFIILVPNTSVKNAVVLAEELRKSISELDLPHVGHITASFGVSGYCKNDTVDTFVNRVDDVMYRAKEEGRNCVCYDNCENII